MTQLKVDGASVRFGLVYFILSVRNNRIPPMYYTNTMQVFLLSRLG